MTFHRADLKRKENGWTSFGRAMDEKMRIDMDEAADRLEERRERLCKHQRSLFPMIIDNVVQELVQEEGGGRKAYCLSSFHFAWCRTGTLRNAGNLTDGSRLSNPSGGTMRYQYPRSYPKPRRSWAVQGY